MKVVSLDEKRVIVPSLEDANSLMSALIEYNSEGILRKYDSCDAAGKQQEYTILFDNYEINVVNLSNAETVLDWLLRLGVDDILIKQRTEI